MTISSSPELFEGPAAQWALVRLAWQGGVTLASGTASRHRPAHQKFTSAVSNNFMTCDGINSSIENAHATVTMKTEFKACTLAGL